MKCVLGDRQRTAACQSFIGSRAVHVLCNKTSVAYFNTLSYSMSCLPTVSKVCTTASRLTTLNASCYTQKHFGVIIDYPTT